LQAAWHGSTKITQVTINLDLVQLLCLLLRPRLIKGLFVWTASELLKRKTSASNLSENQEGKEMLQAGQEKIMA
jgi:hypothetical protein